MTGVTDIWSWLAGTYWYVPTLTLPALQVLNGATVRSALIQDQTVWYLEKYEAGYVVGQCAASLNGGAFSYMTVAGSVTPRGDVALTFAPVDAASLDATDSSTLTLTFGNGRMVERDGQWAFLMQMTGGNAAMNVSHWSYMLQTAPGDSSWDNLPGLPGTSVSDVFPS
ncbi:hypothetical protein [Nitrospirillum pindoramense]|uniref:Uncharacterized protein n=1 Tax=Nitrospirillum amazonense TaxID=28077 RepID=A0A560HFF8_9PROT|nr:hypothetical protein [Nitrospirillum amazonense]TWB45153.1 hypothetical protein FBZ90_102105 [Nitrospirillum amazonense]